MNWWEHVTWPDPINRDCSLNSGLVGWWIGTPTCFGGNRILDLCNKNHGTLTMDPPNDWKADGQYGAYLNFNGTSDRIDTSAAPVSGTGALTVFSAFRTTSAAGASTNCLIGWGTSLAGQLYSLDIESGVVWGRHNANTVNGGSGLNDGNWHTCQWSKGSGGSVTGVSLAADGNDLTESTSGASTLNFGATFAGTIGRFAHTASGYFSGDIQCILVFNEQKRAHDLHEQWRTGFPEMLNRVRRRSMYVAEAAAPPATRSGDLLLLGVGA